MADLSKAEQIIKDKQSSGAKNPYSDQFSKLPTRMPTESLVKKELKKAAAQGNLPEDLKELLD